MTPEETVTLFEPFYKTEFVNLVNLEKRPPLLARYTTLETLEKIITTNEIWFSNPLFMNDLQEMRFGIIEGLKAFNEVAQQSAFVDACGSKEREAIISNWFHAYFQKFDAEHALDVC
jgi:hypothetical protein